MLVVTLIGAYHVLEAPLEQRRLVIELVPRWSLAARPRFCMPAAAKVHAEDIVERAEGEAQIAVAADGLSCQVRFASHRGDPHELCVGQRFDRWTARTCTELSGSVASNGRSLGPARLRLAWRGGALGWGSP